MTPELEDRRLETSTTFKVPQGEHLMIGLVPSLWVAFGFSVLFAVCFGVVGKTTKKQRGENVESVCEDMDDVAERAGHPGLGVEKTTARKARWRTFLRTS